MNVMGKMSNILFWSNHENQGPSVKLLLSKMNSRFQCEEKKNADLPAALFYFYYKQAI